MSLAHILGLKGPSQLVRLGCVGPVGPDHHQTAAIFSPLAWDQSKFLRDRAQRQIIHLPLAHLIQLPLATGVVDGLPCQVGGVERYQGVRVLVDPEPQRLIRRCELEDEGTLPMDGRRSEEELKAQVDQTWYYQYQSQDPRFDRVIAPSVAIFTAYYAPTSQMAEIVLDNDYEALIRGLHRSGAFTDEKSGVSYLRLDHHRHKAEAPMIARACFDSSGVARERTIDVGANLATCIRNNLPSCIRAIPPFDGQTTMTVYGRVITRAASKTLFITQILECDHAFPVQKLEVELDQPGRNSGQASTSGRRSTAREDDEDLELEEIDATGKAPSFKHPPITALGRPGTRFKALGLHNYSIERRVVNRNGLGPALMPPEPAQRNSSKGRAQGGDDKARLTHSTTKCSLGSDKNKPPEESKPLSPAMALKLTLDELDCMVTMHEAEVISRVWTDAKLKQGSWYFNTVRQDGTPRRDSWKRISGGNSARGILIAQISRSDMHAYVLEILRRGEEAFSTLLITSPNCGEIEDEVLKGVLQRIDDAQMLPQNSIIKADTNIQIRRVRHSLNPMHQHLQTIINNRFADADFQRKAQLP